MTQTASLPRRALASLTLAAMLFAWPAAAQPSSSASPIPTFDATSLTGRSIHRDDLLGQPTVLIVTPGRDAAASTRAWAKALRRELDPRVRVRDVLVVDLPFFMDERDALSQAKQKIPKRYHDQTWLTSKKTLLSALGVNADAAAAEVFVLDAGGRVVVRIDGDPTAEHLDKLRSAVSSVH